MAPELPQRLAAILAADIAGYTRLMELDEAATVAAWQLARGEIIDPTVRRHGGRIVKLTGDGFLAEFSTVESAVRAALGMQEALAAAFAQQPADRRVAFRMGVNVGDIWVDNEDVYGAGVNIAARIEALATPGGLCISDAVRAAVEHKVPARYDDLGLQRVKNVAGPVHVWRVLGASQPLPAKTRTPRRRRVLFTVGAGAAIAAALAYFVPHLAVIGPPVRSVEPNTIAVLPFFNIDGSDEMKVFGDGLAEDIINRLTATPPLRVSSRGDAFTLAPNSESRSVRDRLRVAYYVEGSVRRSADSLRVVVQLIDSATGFHIVSRTFDRPVGEYSKIQDEVTKLVVATLRVALPSLAAEPVYARAETASFDAYLAYRRGMDILHRPLTRTSVAVALQSFEESLRVDPGYAAAYAGICLANIGGLDITQEATYLDEAERSCGSALERDSNLIVVHAALGALYLRRGRTAEAESAFERALLINPHDAPALIGLADTYLNQQKLVDAEKLYREAVELQPGNWTTLNSLGNFLYTNGRYEEAAAAYREVVSLDPANSTGWANLASSAMLSGDFMAALDAFERAIDVEPSARTLMNLGMLHYYRGEAAQAKESLEAAIDLAPEDHVAWSNLGDVLALEGDAAGSRRAFLEGERLASARFERNSRDPGTLIDLAWIEAMLGRFAKAQQLIDGALELAPSDPYVHYYDALVRVRMGDTDAALARLQTAVERGYSRALIRAEPHLAALRGNPHFAEIVD